MTVILLQGHLTNTLLDSTRTSLVLLLASLLASLLLSEPDRRILTAVASRLCVPVLLCSQLLPAIKEEARVREQLGTWWLLWVLKLIEFTELWERTAAVVQLLNGLIVGGLREQHRILLKRCRPWSSYSISQSSL